MIWHSMFKRCLFAVGLLIVLWGSVVYAADIDFAVNTGAGYDSNVFRSATAPKEDAYFILAPRATLDLPFNKAYFSSVLQAALVQHISQSDANLRELVFSGLGQYSLSDYVSFSLRDELIISGRLKSAEKLTDMARRREFVHSKLASGLKRELKDGVSVSLEYANITRNYTHVQRQDWAAHTGQLQIQYPFGHKTSAQVDFGLIRKVYEADIDYIDVPIIASLRRDLSSKLDATLLLGLESRRYDKAHRDYNAYEPIVSLSITGRFTPKTTSRLKLQRKVYDSDFAVGYTFVSKAGDIMLVLSLSDDAHLILEGLYSRNDYTRFKWTSNVFEGRVAIQYRLVKWGAVVLGYGYEKWTSNLLDLLAYDYQKHVIEISYVMLF